MTNTNTGSNMTKKGDKVVHKLNRQDNQNEISSYPET